MATLMKYSAVAIVCLALGYFVAPAALTMFGANTYVTTLTNPHKQGTNGSSNVEAKATTCDLANADTSIAASSTGYTYCTVTGVASGDIVLAQLSTTTGNTLFGGWAIQSAKASTTANKIDIMLTNLTGAAAVPSANNAKVGSSTNIWVVDTL